MRGDKKTIRIFWTLFAFNAFFYVPGATFGAYIGVYYRSRGMDVSQIGLLSAIGPLLALITAPCPHRVGSGGSVLLPGGYVLAFCRMCACL